MPSPKHLYPLDPYRIQLENVLQDIDIEDTNIGMDLNENVGKNKDEDVDEEDEEDEYEEKEF